VGVPGHVKDIGGDPSDPKTRIYTTSAAQPYHVDSCDVVGLLCLQQAKRGGHSSFASSSTVYNEARRKHPHLAAALVRDFFQDRKGEVPEGHDPWFTVRRAPLSPPRTGLRARWVTLRARWVTLRARWVTLRARWVTLRARWVTLRARWVTLRARWATLRARWVTLRARWVTLRARWVTLRARWVTLRARWVTLRARWVTLRARWANP
jgi:hypothetical protein